MSPILLVLSFIALAALWVCGLVMVVTNRVISRQLALIAALNGKGRELAQLIQAEKPKGSEPFADKKPKVPSLL